ncbi:type IV pilus twitching motility protein PilT [Frigoriglobus tundricola]|uniref:Twitching motility protein PilT n=1 Tax=Frigoriglobus tundricola TaxID=2774151 RepID=A0A6M5YK07_9BACT|nr:PilT/PilU family type 4a pilus ATPase [Frigoriglobus tundricola]QJW93603.1 Twitching motility protein PilT [Frigoriglobus tundricola]
MPAPDPDSPPGVPRDLSPAAPPLIAEKLRRWLEWTVQAGASDLHVVVGHPPVIRLHGDLTELPEEPVAEDEAETLLLSACPHDALARLQARKNADFSFECLAGGRAARFRATLFLADGHTGGCFRAIPGSIPDLAWAGFPLDLATKIAALRDGLVIVTGATGSGKSTTLAMIVNRLNAAGGYRIITVEEPIEYQFPRAPNSVVTQREVGADVLSFADGLKYGLRQDPDVILVGEVRDRETAQMALSAAETGHLVFSTLHTRDAKGAITRFPDLFPPDAQSAVRAQLAMSLRAIVSQRLLPGVERAAKRHLALEVLWNTHPIASAIRTGKIESIDNYIQTGRDEGMFTFDEAVKQLLRAGKITRAVAEQNVRDVTYLKH